MAELALAIIPILFEGIKLGKGLRGKLAVLKSYMDAVEEVQTLFQVQVIAFLHECKLVLRAAAESRDSMDVAHLVDDVNHAGWNSPDLEECLQSHLGNSLEPFKMLLRLICKKISKLDKDLSQYDERDDNGREGGTITHRICNRVRVPFNEDMYDKEIEKLRRLISNLRNLRERAAMDMARQNPQRSRNMPTEYSARKQHAAMWLKTMAESWSCSTQDHASHRAKLLLAPQTRLDRGCLDVVIHRTASPTRQAMLDGVNGISFASHQLCVRPCEVAAETGLLSPQSSVDSPRRGDGDDRDAKGWRTSGSNNATDSKSTMVELDGTPSLSLAQVGDVCRHLSDHLASYCFSVPAERTSLGYLDSKTRRFELFPGHCPKGQPKSHLHGRLVPLQEIFRRDIDESVSDPYRFWLAGLVVKSALMHHNTVWWPEDWTLDQLCFYERPADELADSLQTLHLTVELPRRERPGDQPNDHEEPVQQSQECPQSFTRPLDAVRQAMTEHGIRNLTLWCVGVALLQIGLWRPVRWDSHVEVRESLPRLERLNRQYWELTDRLVNCDFGKGARLQSPALQDEIYRSVVCELDAVMDEFRRAGIWAH